MFVSQKKQKEEANDSNMPGEHLVLECIDDILTAEWETRRLNVESIFVPRHIDNIPSKLFSGCSRLEMVNFETNSCLKMIGDCAFAECSKLRIIEIPASVELIGQRCFGSSSGSLWMSTKSCVSLTRVTFESGSRLKEIRDSAFMNCTSLARIDLPDTVETIGKSCFSGCTSLDRLSLPQCLKSIGQGAFEKCPIESLEVPSAVEELDVSRCDQLISVAFSSPCNLKSFCGGKALESIVIPATVESVSFKQSGWDKSNLALSSVVFAEDSHIEEISEESFAKSKITEIVIPASVKKLGRKCFSECSSLARVTFAEGSCLEEIGASAFTGCPSLEEIVIPASVKVLGECCFGKLIEDDTEIDGCESLASITFTEGSSLELICDNAFRGCTSLTEISIPTNAEFTASIFSESGLKNIVFPEGSPYILCDGVLMKGNELVMVMPTSEITIPASVEVLGSGCFDSCTEVSSIEFESGSRLRNICTGAFSRCSELSEIEIPANLEVIGERSFYRCQSLERVTFESGSRLKSIEKEAFAGCTNLAEIQIPAGVEVLGELCFGFAFQDIEDDQYEPDNLLACDALSITFESGSCLKRIERKAFASSGIKEIVIPASVEEICDLCFGFQNEPSPEDDSYSYVREERRCQLERITFEENSELKRIGKGAFAGCPLKEIEIPASVEDLGGYLFSEQWVYSDERHVMMVGSSIERVTFERGSVIKDLTAVFCGCSNLTEIEIPASVERLGDACFGVLWYLGWDGEVEIRNCSALKRVTFEAGSCLNEISNYAFEACSALEEIEIPASVERLGDACFGYLTGNEWLYQYDDDAYERYIDRYCEEEDKIMSCKNLRKVTFESGSILKQICENAFYGCVSLEELEIPTTVEQIDVGAFSYCNISNISFSNTLFEIVNNVLLISVPSSCLIGCLHDVDEVEIPDTVEEIAPYCFKGRSSLSHVTFGSGSMLKRIGNEAFSGCDALKEIDIPASVEEICDGCFQAIFHYETSTTPTLSRVTFASGSVLKRIGQDAFRGCKEMREIEIPASVEEIGEDCFSGSSSLSRVTFGSGSVLKRIGKDAFRGCEELREIEIPASVEEIGQDCFGGSSSLSGVTFGSGSVFERIGKWTFLGCKELREIEIPASVEEIGEGCFSNCSSLSRVTYGSGSVLKRIGKEAFLGSKELREIEIPASVEEIGARCFYECCSLSRVTFGSGSVLRRIDKDAFRGCKELREIEIPASVEVVGNPGVVVCRVGQV